MKIYTKKGDLGKTSLIGNTRVSKANLRIECYGTVDELNAYLGLVRDQNISPSDQESIITIQNTLFNMGALLAKDPEKETQALPLIEESHVQFLEKEKDA